MAAISEIIRWLSGDSVALVAQAENPGATLEPAKTLGVASVAPVARKKTYKEVMPRWPAVWHVEVSGKCVTMIDFGHAPEAEIERLLRARFGSRLGHFEMKLKEK